MKGGSRRPRGLTLLETVLAMTILTAGLLIIMAGFTEAGRARKSSQLSTRAVIYARDLLEGRLRRGELEEGTTEGSSEGGTPYKWTLVLVPVAEEAPASGTVKEPALLEARLTVAWTDGTAAKSLQLATVFPRKTR